MHLTRAALSEGVFNAEGGLVYHHPTHNHKDLPPTPDQNLAFAQARGFSELFSDLVHTRTLTPHTRTAGAQVGAHTQTQAQHWLGEFDKTLGTPQC